MSFMDYLKKAWEIIKLNKEVIAEIAADEKAVGPAIGVVAISGVCWAIGALQPLGILYEQTFRPQEARQPFQERRGGGPGPGVRQGAAA